MRKTSAQHEATGPVIRFRGLRVPRMVFPFASPGRPLSTKQSIFALKPVEGAIVLDGPAFGKAEDTEAAHLYSIAQEQAKQNGL